MGGLGTTALFVSNVQREDTECETKGLHWLAPPFERATWNNCNMAAPLESP